MTHNHRGRRKAWCRQVLELARMQGDKRPSHVILEEHAERSKVIHKAIHDALANAHRDRERAEVVALENYPKAGIDRGDVLMQAKSYVHPKLLPT